MADFGIAKHNMGDIMNEKYEKELKNNIDNYEFEDLFNIEDIQKLADAMSKIFEIGVVFTAPDGHPITTPSNFCDFCINVVRKTEKGLKNCYHSDEVLGCVHQEGTVIAPCLSAGLLDAGTSIVVGGKHVASCLMGQVMIEGLLDDEERNRKNAEDIGVDYDVYITSLRKIPVRTKEQFEKIVNFVNLVIKQLSELGYKNFLQKEEIRLRKRLEQELEQEKENLEYITTHDKLTDLCSRGYFEEQMVYYEEKEDAYPIAIVSADVNNLKLMNDIFGHAMGDHLLVTISDIMKEEIPTDNGIIARCGGDEIQLLLPNTTYEQARDFCTRVRSACAECTECILKPSVSMGVHVAEKITDRLFTTLRIADEAMYRDKDLIKAKQDIIGDILDILYQKKILSRAITANAVAIISQFCSFLKMDFQRINLIIFAAQIQDIGMIAFMDEERYKRTYDGEKDVSQQRITICQHVEISNRIARMFEDSVAVAGIILQTHEIWDGRGYPNRLKGEEISLEARIIHMINTFVTFTGEHPVGYGRTKEVTLDYIKSQKRILFDPVLADQFIKFMETYG